MDTLAKISVWTIILVLVAGQLNDFFQTTLLDAGIISKKIQVKDAACQYDLPHWFKDVLECESEKRKEFSKTSPPNRPTVKLDLDGDLMEKFRFDEKEKTTIEKLTFRLNKALVYIQRLFLPKNLVMPCIVGDCNMDKKIKKEREEYQNLLARKDSLKPPQKEPDYPLEEHRKANPDAGKKFP